MLAVLCPGRCPSLCRLCPYRAFALRTVVVLWTLYSVLSPFLQQNYIHIPTPANRRYQWTNRQKLYPLIINAINIITITTKSISLRTYLQFQKINSANLFQPLLRKLFPSYENKIISLENKIILLENFSKRGFVKMHAQTSPDLTTIPDSIFNPSKISREKSFVPRLGIFSTSSGTKNTKPWYKKYQYWYSNQE